ncbi:MAG TPA: hypothetical protein VGX95_09525 [Xanthobacteraceae bacterium]|jgi:hypothetical protein|nr:hypothetical protein [Xanthobacteraceae bacterium]
MGKLRFLTVMVSAAAFFVALSLPAAAQSTPPPHKGPPAKAAPRGPAAGVHPGPGPAGRPAYAGRPGPGHAGRPAYFARHPGFARRDFHGHFYRGTLAWDRGAWRHEWRNGRYGWWWAVGGAWYFYEQPVYPYPTVISDVEVLEDPAMADAPPPDDVPPPDAYPPPGAYPPPVVVAPAPVVVVPPPVVCVGPLCVR